MSSAGPGGGGSARDRTGIRIGVVRAGSFTTGNAGANEINATGSAD